MLVSPKSEHLKREDKQISVLYGRYVRKLEPLNDI